MKVLIITKSVEEKSGWGRYSRAIVEGLIANGVEVELFSEDAPVGIVCVWHPLSPYNYQFSLKTFLTNVYSIRKVAKKTPVVHAFDGWPFGVYGYLALLGMNTKFFINGVGTYSVAPLYSLKTSWCMKRAYLRADKIFCISNYTRRQLEKGGIPAQKLLTVYMGVSSLKRLSPEEESEYKKQYEISSEKQPIILTVGTIIERKGQMETLQAVEILKKKYPHILYILVGSASQKKYVEELQKYTKAHGLVSNVLFVHNADDQVLSFFYSICTVLALNSNTNEKLHHFEGFGLVVLEAAQFGKPAIGSRESGLEDAIEDGKTGFWTKQKDPADIAEKIENIIKLYSVFSVSALQYQENFNWNKTVLKYISSYKGLS